MLGHYVETAASLSHGVVAGFPGPVRRHLAIVDQSRLRSDCLKLALGMQPRRWHVVDVAANFRADTAGASSARSSM